MLIEGLLRGDLVLITREAREILRGRGIEGWNISERTASYHIKSLNERKYTETGKVVRELALRRIAENREREEQIRVDIAK